jgi:hypothetical protein
MQNMHNMQNMQSMQYTELFRICNVQRYLEYKQNMHESAEYAK